MNWPRYCRRRVSRCTDRCGRPSENRGEHVRQAALLPGPPDAGSEFKAAYEHGGVRSGLLLKRFGILGEVKLDSGIFVGREAGAASELHGLRYEQPVDDNDFVRRNACICGGGQELVHPLRGPFAPFLHGELGQTSHEPGQSCPAAAVEDPDFDRFVFPGADDPRLQQRVLPQDGSCFGGIGSDPEVRLVELFPGGPVLCRPGREALIAEPKRGVVLPDWTNPARHGWNRRVPVSRLRCDVFQRGAQASDPVRFVEIRVRHPFLFVGSRRCHLRCGATIR